MTGSRSGRLTAWLQLLRAPNLLTVPGDPLAGFFLAALLQAPATLRPGILAACASTLLYAAGLAWNDYFDLDEDRRERPSRPLPSGRIAPGAALVAGILLALAGLGAAALAGRAALALALALAGLILTYNVFTKHWAGVGPANMGVCRGASLLLGAGAAGFGALGCPLVLAAAVGLTLYITAVTFVAARETRSGPVGVERWLPAASLALLFVALPGMLGGLGLWTRSGAGRWWQTLACGWSVIALVSVTITGLKLGGVTEPAGIGRCIGRWIRALLPIQAALLTFGPWPAPLPALVLLALWPVAAALARRFYSS